MTRLMTRGINETLDFGTQLLLWSLYDAMEGEKDYLQVFETAENGNLVHFAEDPAYRVEYPFFPILPEKVYIIRDDAVETMLFASEY